MILRAFRDFLMSDNKLNNVVRQAGRERLRELIASEVYHGKRPRGAGPVCLAIDRSSGVVYSAIGAPLALEAPIVDLHIYAKGTETKRGSEAVEDVYDALKDLLPQYAGAFGDQTVQTINQEGEASSQMIHPLDADDEWTYHYVVSYLIGAARTVPAGAD